MHAFLFAVLATFTLAGATPKYAHPTLVDYAFEQACYYSGIDCTNVAAPKVVFADLPYLGAYGMYDYTAAPDVIWLTNGFLGDLDDPSDVGVLALGVMIHEIVHYIDHTVNGSDFMTPASSCATEGMAFYAYNAWAHNNGFYELIRWDWATSYPRCN